MLRSKLMLFGLVTLVFLGGAALLYGQRTGSLTIFGDAQNLAGVVSVTDEIDLTKGVEAGDGGAMVEDGSLVLAPDRERGTAQFDIGNPEVTQFQRFQSLKSAALTDEATVTVQFASSLDGIQFGALTSPTRLNASPDVADTIDLRPIVPSGRHFIRVLLTFQAPTGEVRPQLDGFQLDYEVLGEVTQQASLDIEADTPSLVATTVTVNGTVAGTTTEPSDEARRAATSRLAGTGTDFWILALLAVWAVATWWVFQSPAQSARSD